MVKPQTVKVHIYVWGDKDYRCLLHESWRNIRIKRLSSNLRRLEKRLMAEFPDWLEIEIEVANTQNQLVMDMTIPKNSPV